MIFTLFYVLHSVGQYFMDKLKENIVQDDDGGEESLPANFGHGQSSGRRNSASSEEEEKIKFSPTASVQRYRAVERVLRRPDLDIQKVVEFGCAGLRFVKNLKNVWSVREAMFVDLDKQVLEDNKEKIEPRWDDYKCLRENPLQLSIYKGSVTHYNKLLEGTDAVVCIELIEHLYTPDVERMTTNIFQNIQPKVVVITTPNKDFNTVFKMKDSEMRHWDHKFEWTRQEFNDWANGVVTKYPAYEVQTESFIDGPQGTQYLGGCSQMAVFIKINDLKNPVRVPPGDYTLIKQVSDFPYVTNELFCDYVLDFVAKLQQEMEACGRNTTFIIDPEKRLENTRIQYHPVDFYEFKSGIEHKVSNARIKNFFQMMDIEIVWTQHTKEILLPFVEEGCDELIEENLVEEEKPMVEEQWEEYDNKWNVECTQVPPREVYSDDGYIDGEGDFDYVIADQPVQSMGAYPLGMDSPAVDGASPVHKSANLKRNLNDDSLEKIDSLPSIYSFNLEKSAERSQTEEINPFLQPIKTPSPAQKKPRLKELEGFSFRDAIEQYNEKNGIPPFVLTSPKQSSTPKAFRLVKEKESNTPSTRSDKSSDSKLEDFSDASEQKGKSSFYESAADETLQLDPSDSELDQFDSDATFQS